MLTTIFWKRYFFVYDHLNELIPYRDLLDDICAEAHIKRGDKVLDLGSGTGNLAIRFERMDAEVVGIDFSEEGIAIHKAKSPAAQLILADITKPLPFANNFFDRVVSNNVLYAVSRDNRSSVMSELYRVLKPGGKIVISNIIEEFDPYAIYTVHVKEYRKKYGSLRTGIKVVGLIWPTLKIFYYNARVKREDRRGSYDFFRKGEQAHILKVAGFREVSPDRSIYCGQAILNHALK